MENKIITINSPQIRSLCWSGDDLIDWVGGGKQFGLDGSITNAHDRYAYHFDAAVTSPCGTYAVIYEKLGTKGLILRDGSVIREINRIAYHADVYEYPVAIFRASDGRILLVHCPDEDCRLDIDDIETGERLTASTERKPADFFHSRLRVSPDGHWLLSAGWEWHPWGYLQVFNLDQALMDPRVLDRSATIPKIEGEVSAADFLPDGKILVSTSEESLNGDEADCEAVGTNALAIFAPGSTATISCVASSEPVGTLMPIDSRVAVGFFGHPKLFSLATGEVLLRWPEIDSGNQTSSIIGQGISAPPIACDPRNRRFAVANETGLSIVNVPTSGETR